MIGAGASRTLMISCKLNQVLASTLLLVQIEEEAVLLLAGLLKLSEAPARAQLQRVLLNLCGHSQTRKQVMQTLMSMLRAPLSADEAAEASQVCSPCLLPSMCWTQHATYLTCDVCPDLRHKECMNLAGFSIGRQMPL